MKTDYVKLNGFKKYSININIKLKKYKKNYIHINIELNIYQFIEYRLAIDILVLYMKYTFLS